MSQTLYDRHLNGEDRYVAETPFVDPRIHESQEVPLRETLEAENLAGSWEVATPFASGEWSEASETETVAPRVAAVAELATEMKDSEFREALEHLADEAVETHAEQLAGEYGDREFRDASAERLLNEHFQPLAVQTETMLDRFFERLEGYEAEALTEMEIERVASEVLPTQPFSPASEQFLGSFLKKVGKFVTKAAMAPLKLAGKGLALVSKIALAPLLAPLKKLARFLLGWVAKHAINKIPVSLRPLARKLSERLFHELAEPHEGEAEEHEQTEAEAIPAAADVARLEAEFDLRAAELLLARDEAEADHLVSSYGEEVERGYESPLLALDRARADLAGGLGRLQPGESAQPVMEQFLPVVAALYPAVKGGIALIGRPSVVKFVGRLLAKLIQPIIGAEFANVLAPAMADVGMRAFGFETAQPDSRAFATEALAATVEETITRLCELPSPVFENEMLLDSAVREAFDEAASTYFPASMIKPELRETADQHGVWRRMPETSPRKRYAKYSETPRVEITPRVAAKVHTFDGNTLHDHIHDRMNVPHGHTLKTNVRLYQALPGTRASDIARAERIPRQHLHPLTPHAANALLGKNAGLASRAAPTPHVANPHKLYLHQRLYYIEPPGGRQHHRHHVRLARAELLINLRKGEIGIWLYMSERLCQRVSAEFAKTGDPVAAFRLVKPLVHRPAEMLGAILQERHLPPTLRVVSETPNLEASVPAWLRHAARHLAAKVEEWVSHQVAQYLKNNAEEFRRVSADHHDGLTLHIAMSRIPGMELLRLMAQGRIPKVAEGSGWLKGTPAFAIHARPGYAIR